MLSECIPALTRGRALVASCLTALAALAALAGCDATAPERVDERHCPSPSPAVYAAVDVSDTGRSPGLVSERLSALDGLLTDTAVCAGRARVVAFTGSAAATEVLLDDDLKPEGATRRAQLRRIPALVQGAMDAIRARLDTAGQRLPTGGTDVLAQLGLAREFRGQAGSDRPLQLVIWSDGIATSPVDLNAADLDVARASTLADRTIAVPDLTGASVTFAGIGRPAGAVPPTAYVDALKAFYQRTCERTHATTCSVISDASIAGSR
jgi:hypothetical protein